MNGRTSKIRVSLAVASGAMTLALAGLTMLFAVTGAQTPSLDVAPTAADEAAVRAVPRIVVDAWAHGDGAGVAAAFTDDAASSPATAGSSRGGTRLSRISRSSSMAGSPGRAPWPRW